MASDQTTGTILVLEQLIAQHRQRLEGNPDFKAIQTLERTVKELKNGVTPRFELETTSAKPSLVDRLTQPAAARKALKERAEPMTTLELLMAVEARGVKVGGNDKLRNIASVLSAHEDFKSVAWKDTTAWWLKDRPVPGEGDK